MNPLLRYYFFSRRLHPQTADWLARLATAGGSATAQEIAAMNRLFISHDALGGPAQVWDWLHMFVTPTLTGALVQQIGTGVVENIGFVGGDYGTGLKAGAGKNLQVPVNINTRNHTSGGLMLMCSEMDRVNFRQVLGWAGTGQNASISWGATELGGRWQSGAEIANSADSGPTSGIFFISATAANDLRFFRNGTQTAINTASRSAFSTSNLMRVFGVANSDGSVALVTSMRGFGYGVLRAGLTAAQVTQVTGWLDTFRADLGWSTL